MLSRRAPRDIPFASLRVPLWMPAVTITVLAAGIIGSGHIGWLGLDDFEPHPNFSDLRQVTSTADCVAADPHWSPEDATCDPWGRTYNYPLIWARTFAWLGLGQAQTDVVGYTFIGLYALFALILSALVLTRARGMPALLLAFSVIAPPSLYLLVRGNTDTVALLLLAVFAAAIAKNRPAIAVPVLALAAALKIFPAFAWPGLFAVAQRRRLVALLGALAVVGAIGAEASDILRAARATPQVIQRSFGAPNLPAVAYRDIPGLPGSPTLAGWFLLALVTSVMWLIVRGGLHRRPGQLSTTRLLDAAAQDRTAKLLLYAGAGLVVLTYAAGSSFDYRLQVLTFLVGGLCLLWHEPVARTLVVTLVAVQYLVWPLGYPLGLMAEVPLLFVVGYLVLLLAEAGVRELVPARAADPA